jgi:hypothetical protein
MGLSRKMVKRAGVVATDVGMVGDGGQMEEPPLSL